jgi:hypothetical protein
MSAQLLLYSRADCCLCDEMKAVIRLVAVKVPLELEEIDIDSSAQLKELYNDEVPVLFIDGRKAFKYRLTTKELERRLGRGAFWRRLGLAKRM